MKYVIQVNEGPYQHQSADSAYHFIKAALGKGHEIYRVFFYHDGVDNANTWSDLASKNDLDLVVCVAAAQRRGIVDEGEQERNGKDGNNIAPGFRISGLGQLIEGGIQSDRLVVFGD